MFFPVQIVLTSSGFGTDEIHAGISRRWVAGHQTLPWGSVESSSEGKLSRGKVQRRQRGALLSAAAGAILLSMLFWSHTCPPLPLLWLWASVASLAGLRTSLHWERINPGEIKGIIFRFLESCTGSPHCQVSARDCAGEGRNHTSSS